MPVLSTAAAVQAVEIACFFLMEYTNQKNTTDKKTKPMKALNAFMAFRSYYNEMFPEVQQKERSGYMTFLWKNDPCQNKWYILAKAYSVIRDVQGKANSPVAIFLQINAPFINVAEPASYMGKLGYALDTVVDVDGTVLDHRLYSTHMPIDQGLLVTNASVQDVIANSVNVGYVKTQALMPTTDEPLMSMMAVTTQNQVNNGATGSDEAEVLPQDNDNQANQGAAGMDFDFGFDDWNLLPNQAELDYFSGFYENDIDSPYFPGPAMDGTYNPYGDNAFNAYNISTSN